MVPPVLRSKRGAENFMVQAYRCAVQNAADDACKAFA